MGSLFDFSNNLLNWLILVVLLVILWVKVMPGVFKDRKDRIDNALEEAKRARTEGQDFLRQQEARIANAEKEADTILVEAKEMATKLKTQLSEDMKKDAEALQKKIEQQIATERQMAITELRSQAAIVAIRLAEASLPGAITPNVKGGLMDQFVKQLDTIGGGK